MCMLQVGGVDPKQLAVYEEFARNVPGFLPSNDLSQPTGFLAQPMKVSLCSFPKPELSSALSFLMYQKLNKHYSCRSFRPTHLNSVSISLFD